MTLRILCSGDLHLGRLPTRLANASALRHTLGQEAALERLVRHAISEKFHAVVLTGDVIDQSNSYFEGLAALESPLLTLRDANIPVFAVAGNHDWNVLGEFADNMPGFTLLGRDGTWESNDLVRDGEKLASIYGRSFSQQYFHGDPTSDLRIEDSDKPNIVLLHADVGASPETGYAPVSLQRLRQFDNCTWLLGHIHKPSQLSESPLILYPGSLIPLDPGETGSHGASAIDFTSANNARRRHLPLAAIRYENIEIDLSEHTPSTPIDPLVHKSLQDWVESQRQVLQHVEVVVSRIILRGKVSSLSEIEVYGQGLCEREELEIDGITFTIDKVRNRCEPRVSLEEISQSETPPGLLAHKILVLQNKEPKQDYKSLVKEGAEQIRDQVGRSHISAAGPQAWQDEETVRELLLETSFLLLDSFLRQKTETK